MADLIDRRAAIDELKKHRALYCDNTPDSFSKLSYAEKSRVDELDTAIAILVNQPSAQSEQKIDELLPDGTLHLYTDADLSTVGRVLVSQAGTRYGALYYADGERKTGKWIYYPKASGSISSTEVYLFPVCSECGREYPISNYCPNCGAYMGGGDNETD